MSIGDISSSSSLSPSQSTASLAWFLPGYMSGEEWTGQLYFDHVSDKPGSYGFFMSNEQLMDNLSALIDVKETVEMMTVYKCPLAGLGWMSNVLFYHAFVVLKTAQWWWSVEKNEKGIFIQRSRKIDYVKDRFHGKLRPGTPVPLCTDKGRVKMDDVIKWIYVNDELEKKFNMLSDNCKHFASRMFDSFALCSRVHLV